MGFDLPCGKRELSAAAAGSSREHGLVVEVAVARAQREQPSPCDDDPVYFPRTNPQNGDDRAGWDGTVASAIEWCFVSRITEIPYPPAIASRSCVSFSRCPRIR